MFMSVVADRLVGGVYPELAGVRVLLTGLSSALGVDIARAFADHRARIVVQTSEDSPAMTELAAMLAETASELTLFTDPDFDHEAAVNLAQTAARSLGGIDVVVNLVPLAPGLAARDATPAEIEAIVSDALLEAALLGRVSANRMRLTLNEGMILNVVLPVGDSRPEDLVVGSVLHAALAAMTRGEAREWAPHGIRVHAIGPGASPLSRLPSGADVAALALYLASRKGEGLSGHVFDAAGVADARC